MLFDMTVKNAVLWMLGLTGAAGALCWVLGRRARALSAAISVVVAAATLVLAIGVFRVADAPADQLAFRLASPTFVFGEAGAFALDMRVTAFSGLITMGVAFFGLLIVVYSLRYARRQESAGKYYAFTLWVLTGAIVAALANNLLLMLVGWEVVTLMLYLLVALGGPKARDGAAKSFVLLGLSDAALLLGIVLVAFYGNGSLKMDSYSGPGKVIELGWAPAWSYAAFLLLLVGAATKAGAMPFHTWVPAASDGAPLSVMAYLPAAVDKLLGIYLLAFVSLSMFQMDGAMQAVLLIIGAVTIVGGVMMAMVQHDIRRLLSYHAVSQVGYMVLGIGTGTVVGVAGGLFHLINNAVYKSCLFMSAGAVEDRTGETRVDRLGGLGAAMPVAFGCMFVAALAISGVPPLNGFVSKWMIYQGTLAVGPWGIALLVAAVFGSALTLASFVKVLSSVFFGPKPEGMKEEPAGKGGRFALGAPMVVLALLCIALGIFAPFVLSKFIVPAMKSLSGASGVLEDAQALSAGSGSMEFTRGLWTPGMATLLIVLGIVLGLVVFFLGRGSKVRVVAPFLAGETLPGDAGRYRGTNFYKTIEELPVLRTVYHDAESGVYDLYYVGGRFGDTLVQLLRRMHNGQLPLYVSWCIIGLTLIVGYLLKSK